MRAEEHETKRVVAAETTEKTQFKIPISLISSEKEIIKFDLMEKSSQ